VDPWWQPIASLHPPLRAEEGEVEEASDEPLD
jgi:hypothetical protein